MVQISVILPVYNVEEYLEECLDSILKQTFKDIEVICVNDGSKDNSLIILEKYTQIDNRICIINQENQGLSVARNVGLENASGKYVVFIDSDDKLNNDNYLEALYNACERYDADIAVAGIIRGNDKKVRTILNIESEEVTSDYYTKLKLCDLPDSNYVWNKLYRRETLVQTGIKFVAGVIFEDIYYTHKVLYYTNKLVAVPGVRYFYRKRPNTLMALKTEKAKQDHENGAKEMESFFREHNIDLSKLNPTIKKKYKFCGLTLFKTITKGEIRQNVLFSLIQWKTRIKV